jgi:hypothetical protein
MEEERYIGCPHPINMKKNYKYFLEKKSTKRHAKQNSLFT